MNLHSPDPARVALGSPDGEDGAVGALLFLLVVTLALSVAIDRLQWVSYTLVHDLPWVGVAWSGLALWRARRSLRWFGPMSRVRRGLRRRRGIMVAIGLAVLTLVVPLMIEPAKQGLSLRLGTAWRRVDPAVPTRRVSDLNLGPHAGDPWTRQRFSATLSGWLYAPVTGRYQLILKADAAAVLAVDGVPVAAAGHPPEPAEPGGEATLTTGFHRVELNYLQDTGGARLRLRLIPPGASRPWPIPGEYLLADDASSRARRDATAVLSLRRVGFATLVVLLSALGGARLLRAIVRLTSLRAEIRPRVGPPALLSLLFFLLTELSLLFAPGRLSALRFGFLVLLLASPWLARFPVSVPLPPLTGRARTAMALGTVLGVQVLLTIRFLGWVRGRLIIGDDHGSFLYRYQMLAHVFPRLLPYDPWWNGGTLDDTLVLTGAPIVYLLTWPLTHLVPLASAYVWFIPLTGILVVPWSLFATTRLLGFSRLAAAVAALLALAAEESVFFWLFSSGALPFVVAAAWAPLLFALAWRVFPCRDWRPSTLVALGGIAAVGSYSPFFPVMVVPALVGAAIGLWRRLRLRDVGLAAVIGALVAVIHGGWMIRVLALPTVAVLTQSTEPVPNPWSVAAERLTILLAATENPIGLVLGLVGLATLPRVLRCGYASLLGSLALFGLVGSVLRPETELLRLVVPLGFALVPPAAGFAARILRSGLHSPAWVPRFCAASVLLVLALHAWEAWARYGGDSHVPNRELGFLAPEARTLVERLRTETRPDARVLLAGRVVHDYGGHAGYLQLLTGRAMVADCHYHHHPICPGASPSLDEDDATLRRYLELFNVRYIVVTDRAWAERLDRLPSLARRPTIPGILIYETDAPPSYLLEGHGTVGFDYNRITVRLEAPADAVVLKFRWVDDLRTNPPLPMDRVEVRPGTWFIRVRPGQTRDFEIRY